MTSIPRYTIVIKLRQSNLVVKIIKNSFFQSFLHFYGQKQSWGPYECKKRNSEADIQPSWTKTFTNKGLLMWPKTNLVIPKEENGISRQAKQIPRFQLAHTGACYTWTKSILSPRKKETEKKVLRLRKPVNKENTWWNILQTLFIKSSHRDCYSAFYMFSRLCTMFMVCLLVVDANVISSQISLYHYHQL